MIFSSVKLANVISTSVKLDDDVAYVTINVYFHQIF